eukprot:1031517-Alexandrium_andersonii.AAC.1
MCIRDRTRVHFKQPAVYPRSSRCSRVGFTRRGAAAARVGGGFGPSAGAVSYTHLTLPTICSV